MECLKDWAFDKFERTAVALELDFLRGRRFASQVTMRQMNADDLVAEGGAPTNPRIVNIIDRSIRDSCANVVSVSVMMLNDPHAERLCQCVLAPARALKQWQGHENKTNRSVGECRRWAIDQSCGAYVKHLTNMVRVLSDRAVLEDCKFSLSTEPEVLQEGRNSLLYHTEKEFGRLLGKGTFAMIGIRERRGLWYTNGYPTP